MRGKKMENYIICPNCQRTITDDPVIEAAARKEGSGARSITCECGERITFWAITAQLREQNSQGRRFQNWFKKLFKGGG
jgi:RNase P subunit RPR2